MTKLKPLAPERRHPADYRDEIAHVEVVNILSELPADHIALYAYYTGARAAADSISLAHLLQERMDLVERLVDAWHGHGSRIRARSSGHSFAGRNEVKPERDNAMRTDELHPATGRRV